jgi:hypothetical protein
VASLEWVATNLRAVLATHVAFQFVDGRRLRPADDIQRRRLVRVAAKAADLKVKIPGVQCITQRGRRLGWSFETEHPLVPSRTGQSIGILARRGRALRRCPDRAAIDCLSRLSSHSHMMRPVGWDQQVATACGLTVESPLSAVAASPDIGRPSLPALPSQDALPLIHGLRSALCPRPPYPPKQNWDIWTISPCPNPTGTSSTRPCADGVTFVSLGAPFGLAHSHFRFYSRSPSAFPVGRMPPSPACGPWPAARRRLAGYSGHEILRL